jgi:hypothetical protein
MKTKLQVSIPGEPDRNFPIDTRAVVGKGPTADVSLDLVPNVVKQHFRVKLGPKDLDVRLAPGVSPLTYEGRPFAGGAIPYGADFYLDRVRFACVAPNKPGSSKVLPLVLGGVVVLGGLGLLAVMDGDVPIGGGGTDDADVQLFGEAPACPQPDPAGAARKAQSLELAARAKRERYRYHAHDGVDAGRLFSEASKCYAAAGDQVGRDRVDREGQEWRQRVMEEFAAARLRFHTALQNNQNEEALVAVTSMRRMLDGEALPYANWLANEERRIKLVIEATKKK